MKSSESTSLLAALVIAALSRVLPAAVSGAVFSTDSWPLIKLAQTLLEKPNTAVLSLGTPHAKWPQAVFFSVIYTEVSGVDAKTFYAFLGPPLMSFAHALLLYVLLSKLTEGLARSFLPLSSLMFPPFAVYTSAYLKETYAHPLLLLFFAVTTAREPKWGATLVAASALVLSHPLAALMAIATATTYVYITLVEYLKSGAVEGGRRRWQLAVSTLVLSAFYLLHVISLGLPYVLNAADALVLMAYSLALYATYFILHADRLGFTVLTIALLPVAAVAYFNLLEGVPMGVNAILYCFPLVLLTVGLYNPKSEEGRIMASLLLPLSVLVLYTLTYATWMAGITHRFLNYLVYPLALSVTALSKVKPKAAAVLVLVFAANALSVLSNVSAGKDPVVFYWRYTPEDVVFKNFVCTYKAGRVVAGAKYSYMLGEEIMSGSFELFNMLHACGAARRALLAVGREEFVYGVPLTPLHFLKLPSMEEFFKCFSIVYSSSQNYLAVRQG